MWLVFLGLHLFGLTAYNLILRNSLTKKVDGWTLALVMQTGIAIPMLLALLFVRPNFANISSHDAWLIAAATIFVVLLHITNVKSLQYLEAGVYSILYNIRIIFTTVLGIVFLNENFILGQVLGGILIFLAVLTVRQKGRTDITSTGIRWGLAASVVISFLNLFEKTLINNVGYLTYAIPVMILAASTMWLITFFIKRRVNLKVFTQPRMIILMIVRSFSAYGATLAFYEGAKLSVTTYVSSLGVITTMLFGVLLLKEDDYLRQKITATALAAIGLTLILITNL